MVCAAAWAVFLFMDGRAGGDIWLRRRVRARIFKVLGFGR